MGSSERIHRANERERATRVVLPPTTMRPASMRLLERSCLLVAKRMEQAPRVDLLPRI
jgi:hypothetical protein